MNEVTKQEQVARQCDLIEHMAKLIAEAYRFKATMFRAGHNLELLDLVGDDSHRLMDELGDIVNNMDMVTRADEASAIPIFAGARKMFPLPLSEDSNG